jgi:MOB kinase activator 1
MQAGAKYSFLWADGEKIKKPIKVSAPEYVDLLMEWVQNKLDNPEIFPPRVDDPFPPSFKNHIKDIFRRLFRVYAHIYHHHLERIVSLGEEAHLNTCFKHFYYFITEFELVAKAQLAPLQDIIDAIAEKDKARANN